jgi:hypothetical protein
MAAQRPAKIPMGGQRFGNRYGNPPNAVTNSNIPPETEGNPDPADPADPVSPGTGASAGGNGMSMQTLPNHLINMQGAKGANNVVWESPFKSPSAGNETTEESDGPTAEDMYSDVEKKAQSELDKVDPQFDKMSQDLMIMAQQRTAGFERRAESMNVGMGGRLGGAWMGAMRQAGISGAALGAREQYNLNQQRQAAYDSKLQNLLNASLAKAGMKAGVESDERQRGYQIEDRTMDRKNQLDDAEATRSAEQNATADANIAKWFSGEVGDKDLRYALNYLSADQQRQVKEWMRQNELSGRGNEIAEVKAFLTNTFGIDMEAMNKDRGGNGKSSGNADVDNDGDGRTARYDSDDLDPDR